MALIATGIFKKLSFKKQSAQGTPASGSGANYLRRVSCDLGLTKGSYKSNEINPSQQVRDMRHGVRKTEGTLKGELSVGGYQAFMESVLRQAVQAAATTGAITTVGAAVTTGAAGTYTRSGGSFLTDGFKVGDVINSTGWATTGAPNNNHYAVVTAISANGLIMTILMLDGVAVGPKAAGDTVTIVAVGKKTWTPASSQTRDYYTFNAWHSDIAQSEVFPDTVVAGMNISLPPTGMATVDFPLMGLNMTTGTSEYFTAPGAAPTGGILAAANGVLLVGGAVVGLLTGLTINVTGNYSTVGGVVGSNFEPDIFPGVLEVTGQATVLFQDATLRDYFISESEVAIVAVFTSSSVAMPGFTAFVMSRVKFSGASRDDSDKGLVMTMPFQALENTTTGGAALANLQTTLSIQDSAFV